MKNKTEINEILNKVIELKEFKDSFTTQTPKERREFKDKIVYRLMFDKLRSDDHNDTEPYLQCLGEI